MMYSIAPVYGLDTPIEYMECTYNGIEILACKSESGYVLERIYSTNPKDYFSLQPGQILDDTLIK